MLLIASIAGMICSMILAPDADADADEKALNLWKPETGKPGNRETGKPGQATGNRVMRQISKFHQPQQNGKWVVERDVSNLLIAHVSPLPAALRRSGFSVKFFFRWPTKVRAVSHPLTVH